jgi:uncharacterized membrane-anchored protein
MFKKPLLKELFFTSLLVLILHVIALKFFLYWSTDWFDILMHLLGGVVIGLLAMFLFYTSGYMKFPKDHLGSIFAMTIGAVLLVGLTWELWEIFVGFTDVLDDQADTMLDLVMDTIGGFVAFGYGKKFVWKDKETI